MNAATVADNKKLCLNSGEIIQLSDTMRIMFEVEDLKHASPATVSRCGMIWVEPSYLVPVETRDAHECPLVMSFLDHIPPPLVKFRPQLEGLIDTYLFDLLDHTRRHVSETVKTVDNNLICSFFHLLNTYFLSFVPQVEDEEIQPCDVGTIEPWFIFSLIWSIGASADATGRASFDKKLRHMIDKAGCGLPPPQDGSVYDFKFDVASKTWTAWIKTVPEFRVPKGVGFADILVPTVDTVRTSYVLEQLVQRGYHVLVVGVTGTSKTVVIHDRLKNRMPDNFEPILMGFSAQTSANMTQDILDGKFDKRRQGRDNNNDNHPVFKTASLDTGLDYTQWGPALGRKFVIMVDDFNMPMCETYDAQPPIELLRTMVDNHGWYDRKTYRFKNLVDTTLVGAMGPPGGGRNPVSNRMLRHFNFLSMVDMADSSIGVIYNTILSNFVSLGFADEIQDCVKNVVQATIEIYNTVRMELLPTPAKTHYSFNLRDCAKVVQGVMACSPKKVASVTDFVRVWWHEECRVFSDRFVTQSDRDYFTGLLREKLDESFGLRYQDVVQSDRLVYCDFLLPGIDFDSRMYEQAPDMETLKKLMYEYLADFNQQNVRKYPHFLMCYLFCVTFPPHFARQLNGFCWSAGANAAGALRGRGGAHFQDLAGHPTASGQCAAARSRRERAQEPD